MKQYPPERLRNVVLLSHGGAGKTTLAEAMLYTAKATTRLGRVEDGTTVSDWDPDEIKRHISVSTAVLPLEWRDHKINILDAPGYADFVGEIKSAMRAADAAVIVLCAASGVEVGSEQTWRYLDEARLPRLVFVNKLDRENANFARTLQQAQESWGSAVIPLHLPIGSEASFSGYVDLLSRTASTASAKNDGTVEATSIPGDMADAVEEARLALVEKIAETDDGLIERFLGDEEIGADELKVALRKAVAAGVIVPVLIGACHKVAGTSALLDTIVDVLPGADIANVAAQTPDGKTVTLKPVAGEPAVALVFKTMADPYVGKLTYFRVYSGTIRANTNLLDTNRNKPEHIGSLYMMRGKEQTAVGEVGPGDIGAVTKLAEAATGDTLCAPERPVVLDGVHFPEPSYTVAVRPKSKGDLDKLGTSLHRLIEEDPTIHIARDPVTGDTLVSGMGDSHVQIATERMARKFGVNVDLDMPVVPYHETVQGTAQVTSRHKKQTGGHGQFAEVVLIVEPTTANDFEFKDTVVGGNVPKNFIPAVEKGIREALHEGFLAGFPVTNVRVTLTDGKYHPVDSSEMAFKIAGSQGFKEAAQKAHPTLLEPVYHMEITVPDSYTGDIMSDLNSKRARVHGMNPDHGFTTIEADAPLAEVQRYATDLRSMTQGRGTFSMHFDRYETVPAHLQDTIIKESHARHAAAHVH
ncbi:MAG: elongation factor G [Chloroflexota bacterium]|nr:elongation factor G [Chloroflexota bacterium]